jgi:hypothetical protein
MGSTTERFYWNSPNDILALTHGGALPQEPKPAGMELLTDANVTHQVAVMMRIRDAGGEVVGIGSELEWLGEDQKLNVYFTIVIPSRGTLVSHQIKDYANQELLELFGKVMESGEAWSGHAPIVGTCGPNPDGTGRVIAGTGEFEGVRGHMSQTMNFRSLDPTSGAVADNEEVYTLIRD